MSIYGLRLSDAVLYCIPCSNENRSLNLAQRYRNLVHHASFRIASDRWVRQLYTQCPSGLNFVAVVRIGCGRYRVYLLELTSGFT